MDLSKTGRLIFELRKEKGLTQKDIAEKLGILPQTVSKWETGHGFPDVGCISELSKIFQVDIAKLLEGELPLAKKEAGNVKRTKFYVCEKCGNILTNMGDAEIICCGRTLSPLKAKEADELHALNVREEGDEFFITFTHPMEKEHYISFISYVRFDRFLTVKLYPEQGGELIFPRMRGGKMYYYCSKDGLFKV